MNGLKHTCVSPGDNNDLSGQIRDVLYFELAFRGKNLAENGSKGITHGLFEEIYYKYKGSFYLYMLPILKHASQRFSAHRGRPHRNYEWAITYDRNIDGINPIKFEKKKPWQNMFHTPTLLEKPETLST